MSVIAVDIDDVICKCAEGFTKFSNKKWGTRLAPDDYTENWAQMWGISMQEAVKRADEYYKSGVMIEYARIDKALPVLKHLKKKHKLTAVTSRRKAIQTLTEEWLHKHFPEVFADIHYLGAWDNSNANNVLERFKLTKAEICKDLGVEFIIDDLPKHCLASAELGIKSLLFGFYSWNNSIVAHKNITRVADWQAVKEYFDAQS